MNKSWRKRSSRIRVGVLMTLLVMLHGVIMAQQGGQQDNLPWLDVPSSWKRVFSDNVLTVVPDDLPAGAVLMLMIEPPAANTQSLQTAYQKALSDLGPWKPVGKVLDQAGNNDWHFRFGVGVTQLNGVSYTALTAVASRGDMLARFWVLADSDATYNHYQGTVLQAVSSVQDIQKTSTGVGSTPILSGKLDPAFGKGVSGVYFGLVRGIHASVATQTYIADEEEINVFYPDHTYRRRLPLRGLAGDPAWERTHQPSLWGTWQQQGNSIIVTRGTYQERYTLQGGQMVDDRDRPWTKAPLTGTQRINGVFVRMDLDDADEPRLILRSDGSYETQGEFMRTFTSAWNLVVPDGETMVDRLNFSDWAALQGPSAGTYSYENFSLTLRASDGRIWQVNAFIPSAERFPNVRQMELDGHKLKNVAN